MPAVAEALGLPPAIDCLVDGSLFDVRIGAFVELTTGQTHLADPRGVALSRVGPVRLAADE